MVSGEKKTSGGEKKKRTLAPGPKKGVKLSKMDELLLERKKKKKYLKKA